MTRQIQLTQGKVALVDDEDFEALSAFNWHFAGRYARRTVRRYLPKVLLHRQIMNPPPNRVVDHINGDTLDNRRANLRICTPAENHFNRAKSRGAASQWKGVHASDSPNRFRAIIATDGANTCLGTFDTEAGAALAYDEAALIHFGAYARLNFPQLNGRYLAELRIEEERLEQDLARLRARRAEAESAALSDPSGDPAPQNRAAIEPTEPN